MDQNLSRWPWLKIPRNFSEVGKRFRDFIAVPKFSRTLSLLAMLVVVAAIPLTVYVAQQNQDNRQRASNSSMSLGFVVTGLPYYGDSNLYNFTTRDQVDKVLDETQRLNGKIIRVFIGNAYASDQDAANKLDTLLSQAESRGISVIISFIDWNKGEKPQYQSGSASFYGPSANDANRIVLRPEFFQHGYKEAYLPFVKTVVARNKNHGNIYAWEIGNELRYEADDYDAFINFMNDTAASIKQIDSSHPVSTGFLYAGHTWYLYDQGRPMADVPAEQRVEDLYGKLNNIDIITANSYHGFTDGLTDVNWALSHGKRAIINEAGFNTGQGADRSGRYKDSINFWRNKGVSAYLIWAFAPKSINADNGNMDRNLGFDATYHSDYDAIVRIIREEFGVPSDQTCVVNGGTCLRGSDEIPAGYSSTSNYSCGSSAACYMPVAPTNTPIPTPTSPPTDPTATPTDQDDDGDQSEVVQCGGELRLEGNNTATPLLGATWNLPQSDPPDHCNIYVVHRTGFYTTVGASSAPCRSSGDGGYAGHVLTSPTYPDGTYTLYVSNGGSCNNVQRNNVNVQFSSAGAVSPTPTVTRGGNAACTMSQQAPDAGNACVSCIKNQRGGVNDIKNLYHAGLDSCTDGQLINGWCNGGVSNASISDCAGIKAGACAASCGGGGSSSGNGAPVCNEGSVNMTLGQQANVVGRPVSLTVNGSQGSTFLHDTVSPSGATCSFDSAGGFWNNTATCTFSAPGTYTWTHEWKNCASGNCGIISAQCNKRVSITVGGNAENVCRIERQTPNLAGSCSTCIASKVDGLVRNIKNLNVNRFGVCSDSELINYWCNNGISSSASSDCTNLRSGACAASCGGANRGDINRDGKVVVNDVFICNQEKNKVLTSTSCDLNSDGSVTDEDINVWFSLVDR